MRFGIPILAASCLAVVLTPVSDSGAQPAATDDERERALVEALRRDDPAEANRYLALRDARVRAIDELQRSRNQYLEAGPDLRVMFLGRLREAERRYAEASLALLDFLDARDRRAIDRYQEDIERVRGFLEERQRARAELEKLLKEP